MSNISSNPSSSRSLESLASVSSIKPQEDGHKEHSQKLRSSGSGKSQSPKLAMAMAKHGDGPKDAAATTDPKQRGAASSSQSEVSGKGAPKSQSESSAKGTVSSRSEAKGSDGSGAVAQSEGDAQSLSSSQSRSPRGGGDGAAKQESASFSLQSEGSEKGTISSRSEAKDSDNLGTATQAEDDAQSLSSSQSKSPRSGNETAKQRGAASSSQSEVSGEGALKSQSEGSEKETVSSRSEAKDSDSSGTSAQSEGDAQSLSSSQSKLSRAGNKETDSKGRSEDIVSSSAARGTVKGKDGVQSDEDSLMIPKHGRGGDRGVKVETLSGLSGKAEVSGETDAASASDPISGNVDGDQAAGAIGETILRASMDEARDDDGSDMLSLNIAAPTGGQRGPGGSCTIGKLLCNGVKASLVQGAASGIAFSSRTILRETALATTRDVFGLSKANALPKYVIPIAAAVWVGGVTILVREYGKKYMNAVLRAPTFKPAETKTWAGFIGKVSLEVLSKDLPIYICYAGIAAASTYIKNNFIDGGDMEMGMMPSLPPHMDTNSTMDEMFFLLNDTTSLNITGAANMTMSANLNAGEHAARITLDAFRSIVAGLMAGAPIYLAQSGLSSLNLAWKKVDPKDPEKLQSFKDYVDDKFILRENNRKGWSKITNDWAFMPAAIIGSSLAVTAGEWPEYDDDRDAGRTLARVFIFLFCWIMITRSLKRMFTNEYEPRSTARASGNPAPGIRDIELGGTSNDATSSASGSAGQRSRAGTEANPTGASSSVSDDVASSADAHENAVKNILSIWADYKVNAVSKEKIRNEIIEQISKYPVLWKNEDVQLCYGEIELSRNEKLEDYKVVISQIALALRDENGGLMSPEAIRWTGTLGREFRAHIDEVFSGKLSGDYAEGIDIPTKSEALAYIRDDGEHTV